MKLKRAARVHLPPVLAFTFLSVSPWTLSPSGVSVALAGDPLKLDPEHLGTRAHVDAGADAGMDAGIQDGGPDAGERHTSSCAGDDRLGTPAALGAGCC